MSVKVSELQNKLSIVFPTWKKPYSVCRFQIWINSPICPSI